MTWRLVNANRWSLHRRNYTLNVEHIAFDVGPDIYMVEAEWVTGAIVPIAQVPTLEDAQAAAIRWADAYDAALDKGR